MFKITPMKALFAGGAAYLTGVIYMSNNYYKNSAMKRIFVKAEPAYEEVKIGHHA